MPPAEGSFASDDPLDRAFAPAANETPAERAARLEAEAEAKRVSDMIDEELRRQERADKKARPMKLLLLGQSESGKSTTLKNFQLMHSPKAFRAERASWRAVVQLNVVRSILIILEVMSEVQATLSPSRPASRSRRSASASDISHSSTSVELPQLTAEHLKLKMRLSPLQQVEATLIRKLTPLGSTEREATQLEDKPRLKEVAVNSQYPWKTMFTRVRSDARGSFESDGIDWDNSDDPGRILNACSDDMIQLWRDPAVKLLLEKKGVRLEDSPGFFLDDLPRITSPRYVPTDDDILRARLKTLGVTEYRYSIREGVLGSNTRDWVIYDVGGQRSLRAAWVPFFDDMNAILFLAPVSCFDQVLAEDSTVNRLEDSVLLWKSIVSNPLLAKTSIILFLNKIDILKAKLNAGIKFGQFIVSYGNRPNDYESTSNYLRRKFAQILKDHSPEPRSFYCHLTAVTDTTATTAILVDVQDTIIRGNLKSMSLTS